VARQRTADTRIEYIFQSDEQIPKTATIERVAEIAADFMTSFYGIQAGALETQEFRAELIPFWLVSFSDTVKGPMHRMFFVVVLPDGNVVEPRVEKRLSDPRKQPGPPTVCSWSRPS
jgi:hypothetical protein